MNELPVGWKEVSLPELIDPGGLFIDGDWVESKDQDPDGDVRLIQLADVGDGIYRNRSSRHLTLAKAHELGCTFLQPGDILIARMPDPLGRACVFPGESQASVTVVDVAIVRPGTEKVNTRWLQHTLNAPQARSAMAAFEKGTTRKRISRKNLAKISLPLPPVDEQNKIVDTLEELLTQLDVGVETLNGVRRKISRLRAGAFEALLHDEQSEPWPRIQLGEVLVEGRYGTSAKCSYEGRGTPVLRIPNVQSRSISLHDMKFTIDETLDLTSSLVSSDDVLIIRTNGSRSLIGRAAVVPALANGPFAFASYLIRLRVDPEVLDSRYMAASLAAPSMRQAIEQLAATTAGQYNISLAKLRPMAIPVPPMSKQLDLLARADHQTSIASELLAAVEHINARASRLRTSILATAFSGRLATQQPERQLGRFGEPSSLTSSIVSRGQLA